MDELPEPVAAGDWGLVSRAPAVAPSCAALVVPSLLRAGRVRYRVFGTLMRLDLLPCPLDRGCRPAQRRLALDGAHRVIVVAKFRRVGREQIHLGKLFR